MSTVTLWRPTGQKELDLVGQSGWKKWPPRLPEQPIFYPVLNRAYATRIAREWNVPSGGVGYVTRFDVDRDFLQKYPVQKVGGKDILELWIPAEELEAMNAAIVGAIQEIAEYRAPIPSAEFETAEKILGRPIPERWKRFLQEPSWFRRGWLSDECYLQLYRPAESLGVLRKTHPGIYPIGTDGSRETLALDLRTERPGVTLVTLDSPGWQDAIPQADSVDEFLRRVEEGSFTLSFEAGT